MARWTLDKSYDEQDILYLQVFYFLATIAVGPSDVLFWRMREDEDAISRMIKELQDACQAHSQLNFTSSHGEFLGIAFIEVVMAGIAYVD